MINPPKKTRHPVRCHQCFNPIPEKSNRCGHCGTSVKTSQPQSFLAKIKRSLGIEISSELVILTLEEPERFFTNQEIEILLKLENMVVLELKDVPNWDKMFYKSTRVSKPNR